MAKLTHIDPEGKARMVDVGEKPVTHREAAASCLIRLAPATLRLVRANKIAKGEVLNAARLAGIQAAKRTF
jgi:cyclic pyranopterin phosphate synthase